MGTRLILAVLGGVAAGLALAGCDQDGISVYTVPKEPAADAEVTAAPARKAGPEQIAWTVPDGWQQMPGKGMRYATLIVEAGDAPLELAVTPLTPMAGDVLANVNRWRAQLDLAQVEAEQLDTVVKTIPVGERTAHLVTLIGAGGDDQPERQILAAMIAGPARVWFFKLVGAPDRVGPYEAAFEQFIGSVAFRGADVE